VEHHPRRSSAPRAAEARSSSRHKTPVGAKIGAKLAAFQISDTASPKSVTPKETTPKATSPEATNPEAPVLRPVRGAGICAKLAALTMMEKAATDAPQLNVKQQVWKPRNDVFGSYARKRTFDKNATGLPPLRPITDLP